MLLAMAHAGRLGQIRGVKKGKRMNLDNNPTMDQLRDLLKAARRPRCASRVVGGSHREIHITEMERKAWRPPPPPQEVLDNAAVRFVTFWAGKGYVGPEAAASDE